MRVRGNTRACASLASKTSIKRIYLRTDEVVCPFIRLDMPEALQRSMCCIQSPSAECAECSRIDNCVLECSSTHDSPVASSVVGNRRCEYSGCVRKHSAAPVAAAHSARLMFNIFNTYVRQVAQSRRYLLRCCPALCSYRHYHVPWKITFVCWRRGLKALAVLEQELEGKRYLINNEFSAADISIGCGCPLAPCFFIIVIHIIISLARLLHTCWLYVLVRTSSFIPVCL